MSTETDRDEKIFRATMMLKNAQSNIDAAVAHMEHDTTMYGQWSCDYNSWRVESQKDFETALAMYDAATNKAK